MGHFFPQDGTWGYIANIKQWIIYNYVVWHLRRGAAWRWMDPFGLHRPVFFYKLFNNYTLTFFPKYFLNNPYLKNYGKLFPGFFLYIKQEENNVYNGRAAVFFTILIVFTKFSIISDDFFPRSGFVINFHHFSPKNLVYIEKS